MHFGARSRGQSDLIGRCRTASSRSSSRAGPHLSSLSHIRAPTPRTALETGASQPLYSVVAPVRPLKDLTSASARNALVNLIVSSPAK